MNPLTAIKRAWRRAGNGDVVAARPSEAPAVSDSPYSGVIGTIDPLSFLALIDPDTASLGDALRLDFADLANHNFLSGELDLPENYIAEREAAIFLGRLCVLLDVRTAIEVGCYVGGTSAYIARALSRNSQRTHVSAAIPKLYCLDISERYLAVAARNLSTLGYGDVTVPVCGRATQSDVLERLPEFADIIYIDSSHEFDETCSEIEIYSKKLSRKGCLALHDSIQWPGVRKAVRIMAGGFDVMTFATSRGNGLTVMFRRSDWAD